MEKLTTVPFMSKNFTYIDGIEVGRAAEIVKRNFIGDNEKKLIEWDIHNREEFKDVYERWQLFLKFENCLSDMYENTMEDMFYYHGFCEVCNSKQPFIVDFQGAQIEGENRRVNWRERLVCPNCGCNSHERFLIDKILSQYSVGDKILLYERCSKVFKCVNREIGDIIGFEYSGEGYIGTENGIQIEDICKLSFGDENFDMIVVNDTFVLAEDYKSALSEAYRVLKTGGKLIFTVPFDANSGYTQQIARKINGELRYSRGEWNYYNPIAPNIIRPVYHIFGWDLLNTLLECGFKETVAKAYYGIEKGYMGYLPLYFEAVK